MFKYVTLMVPLLSQAWSCSSLMEANSSVQQHYKQLQSESLNEEEMKKQLEDPHLELINLVKFVVFAIPTKLKLIEGNYCFQGGFP